MKSCIFYAKIRTMEEDRNFLCAPEGGQTMPLRFKVDILDALKEKGYTTYTLRKENILSQSTIQKLREGKGLAWDNIERLCALLDCQPGDLLEYIKE